MYTSGSKTSTHHVILCETIRCKVSGTNEQIMCLDRQFLSEKLQPLIFYFLINWESVERNSGVIFSSLIPWNNFTSALWNMALRHSAESKQCIWLQIYQKNPKNTYIETKLPPVLEVKLIILLEKCQFCTFNRAICLQNS